MRKYSKSATRMKTMLIKIQDMRGQSPSEGGMLPLALLFKLIVIRSRVRRRPSLIRETGSTLTIALTITFQGQHLLAQQS